MKDIYIDLKNLLSTLHNDDDSNKEVPYTGNEEVVSGWSPDSTVSDKKIWDLPERQQGQVMKERVQVFYEARQQLKKIMPRIPDKDIITVEILLNLDCTEIVLLSCTTEVQDFSADCPKPGDWKDEEKTAFCRKFTNLVPGFMEGILDMWEKLFKSLSKAISLWPSEGCCTVLEGYSDNFDICKYKEYLDVLIHRNNHQIIEVYKMEPETEILPEREWKILESFVIEGFWE